MVNTHYLHLSYDIKLDLRENLILCSIRDLLSVSFPENLPLYLFTYFSVQKDSSSKIII